MKKTFGLALFITIILVGAAFAVAGVLAVQFSAEPTVPEGYRITESGTNAPNIIKSAGLFRLTGNINSTLIIDDDNIIIDGNGYSLFGSGDSYGIWLIDRTNVTIKNFNIQGFNVGIECDHLAPLSILPIFPQLDTTRNIDITISNCTISNSRAGIDLWACVGGSFFDNKIANCTLGIIFNGINDNNFTNNQITQTQYGFHYYELGANNHVDTSNTINGKLIYQWINQTDRIIPENAAIVIMDNCQNITISNLNLTRNDPAVFIANSNNCTINENIIDQNNVGIHIIKSTNISITFNRLTNNSKAIDAYSSEQTTILNNLIESNGQGIAGNYCSNATILNNQIKQNEGGAIKWDSNVNITGNFIYANNGNGIGIASAPAYITRNNITLNKGVGVVIGGSNGCISNNYIAKNKMGVFGQGVKYFSIISNDFTENSEEAIKFDGTAIKSDGTPNFDRDCTNNSIYYNNFIGNNKNANQTSIGDIASGIRPDRSLIFLPGLANFWDDGVKGNYWSDYNGTGAEPYYINENNQDNHPLPSPLPFSPLEMPSTEPIQNKITEQTAPIGLIAGIAVAVVTFVIIVVFSLTVYFKKRKH
jgi:parallel beta-helix repeat protein